MKLSELKERIDKARVSDLDCDVVVVVNHVKYDVKYAKAVNNNKRDCKHTPRVFEIMGTDG